LLEAKSVISKWRAPTAVIIFTSVGIRPTHDDMTLASTATAFAVPVVRHSQLADLVGKANGAHPCKRDLCVAEVPEGAEMIAMLVALFGERRSGSPTPARPAYPHRRQETISKAAS